jgi:hypothetical protein
MAQKWDGAATFKVAALENLSPLCTRLSVLQLR